MHNIKVLCKNITQLELLLLFWLVLSVCFFFVCWCCICARWFSFTTILFFFFIYYSMILVIISFCYLMIFIFFSIFICIAYFPANGITHFAYIYILDIHYDGVIYLCCYKASLLLFLSSFNFMSGFKMVKNTQQKLYSENEMSFITLFKKKMRFWAS